MSSLQEPQDDLRLPRQPGVIRRFWGRHEGLADGLIAVFWGLPSTLVTLVTLLMAARTDLGRWGAVVAALLVVGSCAGIRLRRTRPILAFAILSIALLPVPFTESGPSQLIPVFGVYSLAVYRSNAAAWIGAAVLEGASTLYVWLVSPFGTTRTLAHAPAQWMPIYAIELLVALAIGMTVGNRRRYLAALIERAHQLARERDQQALLAAVAERARIARDMHDVVSHSLTVMVTLAEGSAAAVETDAARAAAVMRQVAETGREALSGMRQMLGVLGDEGEEASLAPQPTMADIPRLIARFRELGLPVSLRIEGEPPADPALQLAVYRIVQEGLTNALRYSRGPSRVDVLVDASADPLAVVVDDDGLAGMPAPSVGAGRGLIGLGERVSALGGSLSSGHHENGAGWQLAAALPKTPAQPGKEDA